jgi:N-acetylmuramoyl-L-alanine amidase
VLAKTGQAMRIIPILLAALLLAAPAGAQGLSALARLDPAASRIVETGEGLTVELQLSQGVPWRVRVADGPPRLIVDFREVDFAGLAAVPGPTARVVARRGGPIAGGWSRLVLTLAAPHPVASAEMRTGPAGALVRIRLGAPDPAAFAEAASVPDPEAWSLPAPALTAERRPRHAGDRPLRVMLDPGHGGIDPGAEHGGVSEAELMLTFARELREVLRRAGFEVAMTRDADVFVPLDVRVAAAHAAGSDVFLSLHADAVTEGEATGATIYTLAEEATDAAAAALAERHDRESLLAGVSLRGQDDLVARVLMGLAQTETAPRSARLADTLVVRLREAGLRLHRVPRRAAALSVLRSPDVPSALIELGYLSSARDRERLRDPAWRARMAEAITAALADWAVADAAEAALLRQ